MHKGSMVTIASYLYEIKLKNRYRKISNGSNLQFKVEINFIADEGLPTALCSDPDLTDASERAATDPFGNTVTRRKLHNSGQNCSGDIFLFGLATARKRHAALGGQEGYGYTRKASQGVLLAAGI